MAAYRQAIDGLLTSTPPGISPLGAQTAYDQSKWIELQSMQIFPPRNL
jgi:hypothetical protein